VTAYSTRRTRMDAQTFDLRTYSDPSFLPHHRPRILVAIAGLSAVIAFAAFLIFVVVASPPSVKGSAIIVGVSGVPMDYLILDVVLLPVKCWGRPPDRAVVTNRGIESYFRNGDHRCAEWLEGIDRIDIVVRLGHSKIPDDARVRMTVVKMGDTRRAWRRVIPLTSLPTTAVEAILTSARAAGCRIEEGEIERVISLLPRTQSHCCSIFPTFRLPDFHPYEYGTR
jgi:hypothetical protein